MLFQSTYDHRPSFLLNMPIHIIILILYKVISFSSNLTVENESFTIFMHGFGAGPVEQQL